jgi:hypothetical protein
MNTAVPLLAILLLSTLVLHAQEPPEPSTPPPDAESNTDRPTAGPDPVPAASTARILGDIPDGTPPPPAPPKPKLAISNQDVLETTTHEQGGRTITIRKIKPIALPPPPAPVAQPSSAEVDGEYKERLAEYRASHPKSGLLFLGATVFRSKDSPPRTLVRFWPQGKGESITFWSSADFALIAGGIHRFVDTAANTHAIFMGWSTVNLDRLTDLLGSKGRKHDAPEMPEFSEGNATFKVTGSQPAPEDLIPIQSLHDIYNNDRARPLTAYQSRELARIAREAEPKVHPPQPKDITLNYWRVDTPTPAKGGSK